MTRATEKKEGETIEKGKRIHYIKIIVEKVFSIKKNSNEECSYYIIEHRWKSRNYVMKHEVTS